MEDSRQTSNGMVSWLDPEEEGENHQGSATSSNEEINKSWSSNSIISGRSMNVR